MAAKRSGKSEDGSPARGATARSATARGAPKKTAAGLDLRVVLIVAAAIALFALHARAFRFTQDDAYISMRYAKHLVEGHGLVFNVGERVEGYTNFLWTLLLALFMKLGLPMPAAGSVAGVLFGCGAIVAAARLARALEGRAGPATAATAVLLAANSAFALWSTGGLETAMFTFFVTAAFERGLAPGVSARGRLFAPVFFVLASLTRPEGPLFFALWFAMRVADSPGRERLRDAALYLVPMSAYAAWKLVYFGDLLPNTYYAKAGFTIEYLKRGFTYAKEFFFAYGVFGLAPALAAWAALRGGRGGVEARLLAVWLAFAGYVVWIGGDVLYSHRFWLPILPIGCVLVARGAAAAVLRRPSIPPLAGTLGIAALLGAAGLAANWSAIGERRDRERGFVTNMSQTGVWLGANFPPGSTIAITTIGAISYFSGLNVIDLLGLTDREIARNPKRIEGIDDTWREINYNAESVIRRRPDAILFSTGIRPSSAAEKALFLYRDFHDVYVPYYFRSNPSRSGIQTLFRPRPNAPPPDVALLPVGDLGFVEEYSEGHVAQSVRNDSREAAQRFERSWEMSNRSFRWAREWWAATLYDLKDPRGLPILEEIAAADASSLAAAIRVGDDALRRGDLAKAAVWFERVRAADPDDAQPWAGLSEVARLSGDLARAREFAREAVRRWDSSPSSLVMWANLEAQAGEFETARTLYQRALSFDPTSANAQRGIFLIEEIRAGRTPSRTPEAPPPPR